MDNQSAVKGEGDLQLEIPSTLDTALTAPGAMDPTTPKSLLSRDREILPPTPNSLYSERMSGTMFRLQEQDSPCFTAEALRTSTTTRYAFPMTLSPTMNKSVVELDSSRSSFVLHDMDASTQSSFRNAQAGEDGVAVFTPRPIPNLSDQDPKPEDSIGAVNRQLHYPQTPSLSTNSNPPLFDKLYYSPISLMRSDRSLLFSHADGISEVNLRDLRPNFHSPQPDPTDYIIDFDSMELHPQKVWQQSEKALAPVQSPIQSPVQEESHCTTFRFNSDSVEDNPEKEEEGAKNDGDDENDENDEYSFRESASENEEDVMEETRSVQHARTPSRARTGTRGKKSGAHQEVSKKSGAHQEVSKKRGVKREPESAPDPAVSEASPAKTGTHAAKEVAYHVVNTVRSCNCKKSRCLKLYCECFASDQYCSGCNCVNCMNNTEHQKEREEAKQVLLTRNSNAFKPRVVGDGKSSLINLKGCNCRKTGCLKKYCECFQSGIPCGQNCRCVDCRNTEEARLFLAGKRTRSEEEAGGNRKGSNGEMDDDFVGNA